MFWTIDRFEEDFAVLMDDNGVCRSVPRDRLPEQVRQGDVLTEKAGGYQPDTGKTAQAQRASAAAASPRIKSENSGKS